MAAIDDLIAQIENEELRNRIKNEIKRMNKHKSFGLVFEEHESECTQLYDVKITVGSNVTRKSNKNSDIIYKVIGIKNNTAICYKESSSEKEQINLDELVCVAQFGDPIYPYLQPIDTVCNAPDSDLWHALIQADNYHALQLLEYLYAGKVDCIYIDPPYNTGAKDWKYNNDYVDSNDNYRHSKWLSMMKKRLILAKKLLNPKDSVLIITIDEKEYLHLGCLLEELFPEAKMQMVTDVINPRGTNRDNEFSRVEEYIFICRFGLSSVCKTENNMLGNTDEVAKARVWFGFNRGNNLRATANRQFFPIYIDEKTKRIMQVGEPMPLSAKQEDFPVIPGLTAVFPINSRGNESIWRAVPQTTREWIEKGYVKVSQYDKKTKRWTLAYIPSGLQQKIENGEISVTQRTEDGSLDIKQVNTTDKSVNPRSVWVQKYHNATDYGASIVKDIIPNHIFSYPKSLYAVHDTIRFFVDDKPNALIVDFFAGSGTTLHSVNLLNAEDGGKRRCIMVTNNEVSDAEAKALTKQGYQPGDEEWEKLGIARYVTWPRTVCSIEGHDINGNPLKGNYIGSDIQMAEGFKANAAFFKLGFLNKTSVALGTQLEKLIPVLWMKANAIGPCPNIDDCDKDMIILPENKFAILIDENSFAKFKEKLENHPEIDNAYIITDYEPGYQLMAASLKLKNTYQLYRDYLDNFRINQGR